MALSSIIPFSTIFALAETIEATDRKADSGRYLMDNGLELPFTHNVDYYKNTDYASRVLRPTVKK